MNVKRHLADEATDNYILHTKETADTQKLCNFFIDSSVTALKILKPLTFSKNKIFMKDLKK